MASSNTPATLMLVPDLPVADEWRQAAAHHQPVVPVRVRPGPLAADAPTPDHDGVYTLTRPRLWARRYRREAAHRLDAAVLTRLVDHLAGSGIEITVAHGHFAASSSGLPGLRSRRDIPFVVSEHSSALTFDNPDKVISSGGLRTAHSVYTAADRVLPVNVALREAIARRGLASPNDMTVLANPVDTKTFRPAPADRRDGRVVTVARLVGVKRLDLMIEALAMVTGDNASITLHIVGDGPERGRLVEQVRARGLGQRVVFHGRLDRPAVADVLRTASVFALSSHTENLPVAALEAMASGLPVVAPAVGGLTELLADAPGQLYEPGNPAELANALIRWIGADEKTRGSARHVAESRYSVATIGAQLSTIYSDAIARRSRPVLTRSSKG
ncbi:MAG: glycosyltransferase family 4 protein [Acidimicrobiales bacterium]